jgi:hypothetical protein
MPLFVFPFNKSGAQRLMGVVEDIVTAFREWRDLRLLKNYYNEAHLFEIIKDPSKSIS